MAQLATHDDRNTEPRGLDRAPAHPWYQRLIGALMLPKEHGAWAMLVMPYLLGTLVAGWRIGWPSLLLLTSILTLFTASRPLDLVLRERRSDAAVRLVLYAGLGGAAGLLLLIGYQRWALLPLAAVAGAVLGAQLLLRQRRVDRTWPARLVSIAALSATAPAAYYASTGALDNRTLALWLIASLYSGASVFYVRLYYRPPSKGNVRAEDEARRKMAAYVGIAALVMVAAAVFGWFPTLGVAVMIPPAVKLSFAWSKRGSRPSLKRIGMTEMGYSALFLAIATLVFTAWR